MNEQEHEDSRSAESSPGVERAPWNWLFLLLIVALVIGVFLPMLWNEFVPWDDDELILRNPFFRGFSTDHLQWMFTTFMGGHYQPLTWLSFAMDHLVWGM
ncbi:MAG: hypothetical protein KJ626_02510, partial [Verrucomicrobia bacterium]|nr:hypothetical protein [Verrucomicrobiota bacterium]